MPFECGQDGLERVAGDRQRSPSLSGGRCATPLEVPRAAARDQRRLKGGLREHFRPELWLQRAAAYLDFHADDVVGGLKLDVRDPSRTAALAAEPRRRTESRSARPGGL